MMTPDFKGDASRSSPVVTTTGGKVRGITSEGVYGYRGIPYGAATGGAGRFRPPKPPLPWTEIRALDDCGSPCPQINTDFPAWVDPRPSSEDCLYLNVWAPKDFAGRKLAVMFWIHGGAYLSGSGGLAIYDGAALCRHGEVVVVTVNHRLGALGYLYLGALSEQFADSGNAGNLDLIAALQWVRDNIQAFGGDPGNVTIFGESGGGSKVTALLGTPLARPLFHKAIVESGSLWKMNTKQEAHEVCELTLSALGIAAKDHDRLLDLPADSLVSAADVAWKLRQNALMFRPVIDGRTLMEQAWEPLPPPSIRNLPMLIGTTRDEAAVAYFVEHPDREPASDAELVARIVKADWLHGVNETQVHTIIDGYRQATPRASRLELLIGIATDLLFRLGAIRQSEQQANQRGAPVFMYEFTWRTPCFGRRWSLHGLEIPFVFGNLDYEQAWDAADTPAIRAEADPQGARFRLSRVMMSAWAEFARKGDPSTEALPEWPRYDGARRATMRFDAECRIELDPRATERTVMESVVGRV